MGGEPILQNGWIIWSLLLYFNFQTFKARNSSSSIRFQCILPFWDFWNFCKLKSGEEWEGGEVVREDLISWRNQSCRRPKLFAPPFCHSCQVSRINHEVHGFGKFFWISHEFDKSQGFSWNSRFFLKEIPKLYRYAVLYIPQLLSVLSIFVFVAFRCCKIMFNTLPLLRGV